MFMFISQVKPVSLFSMPILFIKDMEMVLASKLVWITYQVLETKQK